jgi:hypothetical protein
MPIPKHTAPKVQRPSDQLDLRPGQSLELLKELHILTRDGKLNQDSRRKLKQVNHLFQFIEKILKELPVSDAGPTLADHGAGKSYLGFIIYDLFFKSLGQGHIYGIETRSELVDSSAALAKRLGFERMQFLNTSVAESVQSDAMPAQIDVVTALHACDTATDDAIAFGLQKEAKYMVLVPCCQAELARVLNKNKALNLQRTPLAELWRHPLHTREMGSQLTNVLRCLYLEANGYQVTVTELVGWEHSMKNELILAKFTGQRKQASADRLNVLLQEFGLEEMGNWGQGQVRINCNLTPISQLAKPHQLRRDVLPNRVTHQLKIPGQCGLAHALQSLRVRQHRACKPGPALGIGDQERWKILNIQIAKQVIVRLNIYPHKPHVGQLRRQLIKDGLVFTTGTAPLRTQAKHMHGVPVGGRGKRRLVHVSHDNGAPVHEQVPQLVLPSPHGPTAPSLIARLSAPRDLAWK